MEQIPNPTSAEMEYIKQCANGFCRQEHPGDWLMVLVLLVGIIFSVGVVKTINFRESKT